MIMNVGFLSYFAATIAFAILALLLVSSWRGKPLGKMVILAGTCTTAWAFIIMLAHFPNISIPSMAIWLAEFSKDASWFAILLKMISDKSVSTRGCKKRSNGKSVWEKFFAILLVLAFIAIFVLPIAAKLIGLKISNLADVALLAWLAIPISGLFLLEQIYRSANSAERWVIRYLCLGIGGIFAYDFFLFSDALLFKKIDLNLWRARGFVNTLCVPLIAISIARNPAYDIAIHVSRQVVFHSITVIGAGLYLLFMAGFGYIIQYYGGTWGGVLQIIFFSAAGILLTILFFSDNIRSAIRVFVSKHFYSFKYDYREEWLRFTQALSGSEDTVPERVIRSICSLVNSNGGLLWNKTDNKLYVLSASWNMLIPENVSSESLLHLDRFLNNTHWVVDIDEYLNYPDRYQDLSLPEWLITIHHAWLIVPLVFKNEVQAFVLIRHATAHGAINWEDRDLLKMAGQQAAIFLAQYLADKALVEARQFDAFNRLSAYIVHDLKNILAQQSLIISNAERHRSKPEFFDDVIGTINNSVGRMTRLMEQLRMGVRGTPPRIIDVSVVLKRVVEKRANVTPQPSLNVKEAVLVHADGEQLGNVFSHIIQNAQEATPKTGLVEVSLDSANNHAVIEISDTGSGMDGEYLRTRLFKPFESTKGLTGMGIGLFESREYVRSLGGEISVKSEKSKGTVFRIVLPSVTLNGNQVIPEIISE